MKSLYRKVFTEKRNPGCHGKFYKKMSCKHRKTIDQYFE